MLLPKKRVLARVAGLLLALGALLPFAAPGTVLAHERRSVGPYTFVVGWMSEPALVGQPNGIDLRISTTDGGAPVEAADKTLKAAIAFGGGQPKEFSLRAVFGKPGAYTADLIPTKAGSFIFMFTGTLESTTVNQKFESGPGRFDDVQATDKLQFPDVVPAPGQLASSVKESQDRVAAAEAKVGQTQMLGIAGTVFGLLGLATAVYALTAARRTTSAERTAVGGPSIARS